MPKKKAKTKHSKVSHTAPRKVKAKVKQVKHSTAQALGQSVHQASSLIHRFEREIEALVNKISKKSEKSRRELSGVFEDIIVRLGSQDFATFAAETREGLQTQAKRLAEDVIKAVKDVESLSGRVNLGHIAQEMKQGLGELIEQLRHSGLIQTAKQSVKNTKQGVFQLLNIPSQNEVLRLERKIVSLEKKLSGISRRAA